MIGQTVADILRFCDFQDGWRHHLGFQKFEILTSIQCRSIRVILPNLIKIGQTVAEIWRFNGFCFFQNGGRSPSWTDIGPFNDALRTQCGLKKILARL